jgi:hypothetical protein
MKIATSKASRNYAARMVKMGPRQVDQRPELHAHQRHGEEGAERNVGDDRDCRHPLGPAARKESIRRRLS